MQAGFLLSDTRHGQQARKRNKKLPRLFDDDPRSGAGGPELLEQRQRQQQGRQVHLRRNSRYQESPPRQPAPSPLADVDTVLDERADRDAEERVDFFVGREEDNGGGGGFAPVSDAPDDWFEFDDPAATAKRLAGSIKSLVHAVRALPTESIGEYEPMVKATCEAFAESPEGRLADTALCSVGQPGMDRSELLRLTMAQPSQGLEPQLNRVHVALSSTYLANVSTRADNLGLLSTLVDQMMSYVYEDEHRIQSQPDPYTHEGSSLGSSSFGIDRSSLETRLDALPFFEKNVFLQQRVDQLVAERTLLQDEESQLPQRRKIRRRLILNSINGRRRVLLIMCYRHWFRTMKIIKEQRERLLTNHGNARRPDLKTLFKAWRGVAVTDKLRELDRSNMEHELEIHNLQEELNDAEQKERELLEKIDRLQIDEARLGAKLTATREAIEAQRVPETLKLMRATADAGTTLGSIIMDVLEPMLEHIFSSPSRQKLAGIFFSQQEEDARADRDAKQDEQEAKERHEVKVREKKREEKEIKIRENKRAQLDARLPQMQEELRTRAEEEYKESLEDPADFKKADMEARGDQAAATAAKMIEAEYTAFIKERKEKDAEYKRKMVENQVRQALENEAAFEAEVRNDELKSKYSENALRNAIDGLMGMPVDDLLLRWVKYQLRRTCWKGFQYRRKVENFHDDLRDGVSLLVLFKRIVPHVWNGNDPKFESEGEGAGGGLEHCIDPNVRFDAVFEMAQKLQPPATGFGTSGHLIGLDGFMNASFISRMALTFPAITAESGEGTKLNALGSKFRKMQARWQTCCETIERLAEWDTWEEMRDQMDDAQLRDTCEELAQCTADVASLLKSLRPLAEEANRGHIAWRQVQRRFQEFQWKMFACKVKQEEEAPAGVDINPEEHAPLKLVDHKFDRKFIKFTEMKPERFAAMCNEVREIDAIKEAQWEKTRVVVEQAAEQKRKVEPGEADLTEEELEEIKARIEEYSPDELVTLQDDVQRYFRLKYNDISRIFKFYAAGPAPGSADGLSEVEWWTVCNDCKVVGGKSERDTLGKNEVDEVFAETETEEEIAKREAKRIEKEEADAKAEFALMNEYEEESLGSLASEGAPAEQAAEDENGPAEEAVDENGEIIWELDDDQRELGANQWIEAMYRLALRKFGGDDPEKFVPYVERLRRITEDFFIPNACKSNTDSFRGEISMDEVQGVFKRYKPQLMAIFNFYARTHPPVVGQPTLEPSLDGPAYMKMCKESRLLTRSGDLRNNFPEPIARKVFNDVQAEEEGENSVAAGGGADEMIYMEWTECLCAIASFKNRNPYIALHTKLEETLRELFDGQKAHALKPTKRRKKKSAK